jgi:RimJ/RimL family protein N-acetyltransferase
MTAVDTEAVLVGERVRLRPARDDDAPHFIRWANEPEFAWHQWGRGPGRFADEAAVRAWLKLFTDRDGHMFVIEHVGPRASGASAGSEQGHPVGFANYRDWRPKPRSCEIGIGIGEPALWSKGLGRDALRALLRHLTGDLGAHRVTLSVLAFNDRAIASYKACGFEVEGIERDAVMTDRGTYADDVRMAYVAGQGGPAFDPRPVILEGQHVRLEPLRMDHAAELYEAVKDPEIWRWISGTPPGDVLAIERYVRAALDLQIRGEHMPWITRRQGDGVVLGTTRYGAVDRANRSLEIGWTMLSPAGRRTAANTEAKYLQLRHAFEELGALRVWLKTDVLNERSQRAIERIGGMLEGTIRNERIVTGGRVRDARYYSFIDREWPEKKRHLEGLLAR